MNARVTLSLMLLLVILLAACAPAATPTAIAVAPAQPAQSQPRPYVPQPLPTAVSLSSPITAAPAPQDNYFQSYGVNPYTDAAEDHLSTFALDVDTASYTVARRYVMDGNMPPAEAVRVEEFVNYFQQDYANPPEVAFGIFADGAPSPFEPGTAILRIGIQGYQVPEDQRKPASLTFVIDISGSMGRENRLELVKKSLLLLVERLRPDDTVAIVAFGSDARVVLNPASGEDRPVIRQVVRSLRTEGSTNAEAGLRLGYSLAYRAYRTDGINRVILCSDGVANVGATSPDELLAFIRGYADRGITLTTVGFGMGNFNDVLMEQLANKGDGSYAYVDDLDEARRLFVDDLTSTLQVIALNAKVQVDFNNDTVSRYRLIGYENRAVTDQDFRNDMVDAGEIGAGHSVTALYALQLQPEAQGRVATVQLRWEDPQTHQVAEINGNFNTWDLAPSFENASNRYQLSVVVAQYAEVLRQSPWAAETSIQQILSHAVRLAGLLPEDPAVAEFVTLVSRASQIDAIAEH